ncbi:MAG TPA: glutathione peroxidase [Vicinamibacterales bacterium]|nr:glutathione peroxidase [Vicinamibacterales bacterium]
MKTPPESIYGIEVTTIDGRRLAMDTFRDRVLLIVNVASACGYTPQYAGLERLYRAHKDDGLVVLGFPCNQFGGQEPDDHEDIQEFCTTRYDVTFPMFAKIEVNGDREHPLYTFLKSRKTGLLGFDSIKWNFSKFLVGRDGDVIARYGSRETPEKIEPEIVAALRAASPMRP